MPDAPPKLSRTAQKKLEKQLKEQRWKEKRGKKRARKAEGDCQVNEQQRQGQERIQHENSSQGVASPASSAPSEAKSKKMKKKKGGNANQDRQQPTQSASLPEVQAVISSLGVRPGTLSDRLNPDHPHFDTELKANWKKLPKKGRAAIVEADKNHLASILAETASIEHPFNADSADHCETPPQAYKDVAPLLDLLATTLGKTRATLRIFDPYFCAGTMKKHLGDLGFTSVHNECSDFYANIREGKLPPHDVLLTNPPYSR
jgi:hypothetical protein